MLICKDIDRLILLNLEDNELKSIWIVNKYFNILCKEEIFWRMRVSNKFHKSLEITLKTLTYKNSKFLKEINKERMTYEQLEEMKKFFGFEKFIEFNRYLNKLPLIVIINIFYSMENIGDEIKNDYDIDRKNIPKFVNYDELIYELRRLFFLKRTSERTSSWKNDQFKFPGLKVLSNLKKLNPTNYEYYKDLGLKD